jgi:hypothetical protein
VVRFLQIVGILRSGLRMWRVPMLLGVALSVTLLVAHDSHAQFTNLQTSPDCLTQPPGPDPDFNKYMCGTATFDWDTSQCGEMGCTPSNSYWIVRRFAWNGSMGNGGYDNGWKLDHGDIWDRGCQDCTDWYNRYHYNAEANWHFNQQYLSQTLAYATVIEVGIRWYTAVYWCFAFRQAEIRNPITGAILEPARTDYGSWKGSLDGQTAAFYTGPGAGCPP